MSKPTFAERFRYWFDGVMARGAGALIGLLALATLVFILIVAVIVELFGIFPTPDNVATPLDFAEVVWGNLMRSMDAGTVAGDVGWPFRALMLVVTLFGILTVASLIGIVSGAFDERVAQLRKGRSRVLESDHTVILGWSSKIVPIVSEICTANQSRKRSSIVILASRDKVEMEELLADAIPNPGRTKIIVRTGDPMSLSDLGITNLHSARSIIILPPDESANPDAVVIKTALAVTNSPDRKAGKYHIIAEIQRPRYLDAAKLVGRDEAHFVLSREMISRIMVQTSRQSGLSVVYSALLDFDGDEMYFSIQPSLVGQTYAETQRAFNTSAVIGILTAAGAVELNPAASTVYAEGDQLIVIAKDDSAVTLSESRPADAAAISSITAPAPQPERTLILGYHYGLPVMLDELAEYVAPGSGVMIVSDQELPHFASYPSLTVDTQPGDVTDGDLLEALDLAQYGHVIVLADRNEADIQESDARTLITLLNLRDLEDRLGLDLKIVSEMLDDRNRELAEVTNADDFIVSDKLVSLVVSQISENRQLTEVFENLFSSEGSEIYLQPAEYYVTPGTTVDFYTVLDAAQLRGETAIGYRIVSEARNSDEFYGVNLNPTKTKPVTFAASDKVIVLAAG